MNFIRKQLGSLLFAALFSMTLLGSNSDCNDCCTGQQITVPQIAPDTQFTNPICPDQLDPETFLILASGALEKGNILNLLKNELYNHTNPLVIRSLLDLPSLRPYFLDYCGWQGVAQLFYNHTDPVWFTKCSPFIDSYVKLNNTALTDELDLILQDINNAGFLPTPIVIDIPQTLSLFQNIRMKEYKAGCMFSVAKEYKNWNFSYRIPVYYLIHHFFLNDAELEMIKRASFLINDGEWAQPGTVDAANAFFYNNLVSDKVGTGDSRFMALYNVESSCKNDIWLGAIATLPTAAKITEGLVGARFRKSEPIPPFDVLSIVNSAICNRPDKVTQMLESIGIAAVRRLSLLLADTPLGNGGHFGVGPHLDIRHFYNDVFSTRTMFEAEFFSSKDKKRFFIEDKSQFNFNRDLSDGSQASQNLAFIDEQILNTFFPICMKVRVQPGWIMKVYHEWMLDFNRWQLVAGFDYWYQSAEKLSATFCGSKISLETLNKGHRPSAYQGKIFGSFNYYHHGCDFDWDLSLTYDDTLFHKGIGKDYTVGFALSVYL